MSHNSTRKIGAHLSVAGGLIKAAQNMIDMGGNALQIFSGSPRSWARKPIEQVDVSGYLEFCKKNDFGPTFIHALYLLNLASDRADLLNNSINAISYDLSYNAKLGGGGVVVHLGSHLGKGFDAVFPELVKHMKGILQKAPKNSTFLIENSAGQDGKLCSDFAEIKRLFDALPEYVKSGQLGWCLDTCHAHAAGHKLQDLAGAIEQAGIFGQLRLIHLNDSRDPYDSGRDRHENIGKGLLGVEAMQHFVREKKFAHLPLILEVPGYDGMGPDAKNVEAVKHLL